MHDSPAPPIDARLTAALDAVYRAFAAPTPPVIAGCPCCIDTRGVDVLLTTPLRQLSGQALWRYVSGAFLTVGGERDFRYLLPRILEVSVSDPGNANNAEIVLGKLALANWQAWPPGLRQPVETVIDAWVDVALAHDIALAQEDWPIGEVESVLCGAARAGLPLARWLDRLRAPAAARVLADLKRHRRRAASGFWEAAPAGFAAFSALLDHDPA